MVPRSIRRVLDKNLTFHKAIAWMLVVSSAMHIMAHYYNYERLARYSPPNTLPIGEQAQVPVEALPFDGAVGVSDFLLLLQYLLENIIAIQPYSSLFYNL